MDDLQQAMTKGYCVHPDTSSAACGAKIIRAHTVQRNRGLADIAENGHVISFKRGFEDIYHERGGVPNANFTRDDLPLIFVTYQLVIATVEQELQG